MVRISGEKRRNIQRMSNIMVGVICVISVFVVSKSLSSGGGNDDAYVCLSDDTYQLITRLDQNEAIEIATNYYEGTSKEFKAFSNVVKFSPDKKYIYFYCNYDSMYETATLCRAEYGKLKKNVQKNSKYIETIATNVPLNFEFLEDNSIVYANSQGTLYYNNGKESVRIAEDVMEYYSNGADKIVFLQEDSVEGYTVYSVNTDDKEPELLAENIVDWMQIGEKLYFTAKNGMKLNISDYVEDTLAEADAEATEPKEYDFVYSGEYDYEMINDYNANEEDYYELYTSCIHSLYLYGENFWPYDMQSAAHMYWGENTEGFCSATQKFIDKFADSANEEGYILVTDEVKSALQEIQKNDDDPDSEWKWLWLCYDRKPILDENAYTDAVYEWEDVENRNFLREQLQDDNYGYDVCTLYCYENDTLTPIDMTVLDTESYAGGFMYNTIDMITEKVDIKDVSDLSGVYRIFRIDDSAENHVLLSDGTTCKMSADAAKTFSESYADDMCFTNKAICMIEYGDYWDEYTTLSIAPIENGVAGDFSMVNDDGLLLALDDTTLYYASDIYENWDQLYGDLYSYDLKTKTNTCLATNIILKDINFYKDDTILAYTNYNSGYGYELVMIDAKGKTTLIAADVTEYIRVNESVLLYISNGNLYSYDGKEKEIVSMGVDCIWSKNEAELYYTFGAY